MLDATRAREERSSFATRSHTLNNGDAMPVTVPLVGRNLCFWCIEAFRKCPHHDNFDLFWNDVTVKNFSDESDGFRIVNEKDLVNVESNVQYSENGSFFLPPNGSSLQISTTFAFKKCRETLECYNVQFPVIEKEKMRQGNKADLVKIRKCPKEKKEKNERKQMKKWAVHRKVHENSMSLKTTAKRKIGKKDPEQKMFICDICELSFTLRHNLQSHLVIYHGENEDMSQDKVVRLRELFTRK